jgi:cytochrome c oxidase assembly protein subunit 15
MRTAPARNTTEDPKPGESRVIGHRTGPSDHRYILTLGFGTTVAMWAIGYVCRIPPVWVPSWVLLVLFLVCLASGGFVAGRYTGARWQAGFQVGVLSSILNLLILGSLLSGDRANQVVPSSLWWIPGSILAGALLGSLGSLAAGAFPGRDVRLQEIARGEEPLGIEAAHLGGLGDAIHWTAGFSAVAAFATFCLLVVGGFVTSEAAGLSVVDWPTSFGYNMFLYPLSRMTGGVYFEHAHRLFGSLVGLTTLVLTVHLFRVERRAWVRWFSVAALALVIVQGILGGLRVTGHFTSSTSPLDTRPSLLLAVVHGVTGQLFFSMLVALSAFTSSTWISDRPATRTQAAASDRVLTVALVLALLVQLVLGALLRHLSKALLIHISMAAAVTFIGVAAGARAAGLDRGQPVLQRLGKILLILLGVQVLLGIGALVARGLAAGAASPPAFKVVLTTAHQASGACLLGTAVLLLVWTRRLLRP